MRFHRKETKLEACKNSGPGKGAELFLVEGDSASSNVAKIRDLQCQAVLPMQGKPMNAIKASDSRVRSNVLFRTLTSTIGAGIGPSFDLQRANYERILLLFDPDADGIHCGALMLMFFQRLMPQFLETGRIHMVRAPLFRVSSPRLNGPVYANSEGHYAHIVRQLEDKRVSDYQTLRYRGLGSLEEDVLRDHCVHPASRKTDVMGLQDAAMAMEIFAADR